MQPLNSLQAGQDENEVLTLFKKMIRSCYAKSPERAMPVCPTVHPYRANLPCENGLGWDLHNTVGLSRDSFSPAVEPSPRPGS